MLATILFGPMVPAQDAPPTLRFRVTEFVVEGDNPLRPEETEKVLRGFTGQHEGLEGLLAAADALEKHLANAGYAFHRVSLPQQTLVDGVVRLKIVQFRVKRISLKGNQFFDRDNILDSVPGLKVGAAPNTRELSRELDLANAHPSKDLKLTFRDSPEAPGIEAQLKVSDRPVQEFFANLNNTGTKQTGNTRLSLGYQHSNLFNRDLVLTLTGTTSPEKPSRVEQYGINLVAPVYPWSGSLRAYLVDSDVDSGQVADFFDVAGAGRSVGVSYTQKLLRAGALRQSLTLRLEDKHFTSDVNFSGAPIGVDVRSRPLSLRYTGEYPAAWGAGSYYMAYAANLSGGGDNDADAYAASRSGAAQNWDTLRLGATGDYLLPRGWLVHGRLDGQYSDEPLISGEQFGIGGANSVRGFDERALAGDSGAAASLELWGPPMSQSLRLLGFVDLGYRKLEDPLPTDDSSVTLASTGLGLRWSWQEQLSIRADLARVARGAPSLDDGPGDVRAHFSIFFRL